MSRRVKAQDDADEDLAEEKCRTLVVRVSSAGRLAHTSYVQQLVEIVAFVSLQP